MFRLRNVAAVFISAAALALAPAVSATAIVGGAPATPLGAPWHAMVSTPTALCGGTIISPTRILTAAHCVAQASADGVTVRVGAINVSSLATAGRHDVTEVVVHPGYDPLERADDLAILVLARPLAETAAVHRAGLPVAATPTGISAQVAGWGVTSALAASADTGHAQPGEATTHLMAATVVTTGCEAYGAQVGEGHLCAAAPGTDACHGDSGSGLVAPDGTVIGSVAFGRGCADPAFPGVYTATAHYLGWITATTPDLPGVGAPTGLRTIRTAVHDIAAWTPVAGATAYIVTTTGGLHLRVGAASCALPAGAALATVAAVDVDGDLTAPTAA